MYRVISKRTVRDRAARGARCLDEAKPNWVRKMPKQDEDLDMEYGNRCILGYVYGSFWTALPRIQEGGMSEKRAAQLGFSYSDEEQQENEEWSYLTECWLAEIKKRQSGAVTAKGRS